VTSEPETTTGIPDAAEVAATFVELTGAVAAGADAAEVFTQLAERCVDLLPAAACGVLVLDPSGTLEVVGSSDPSAYLLDLFQVQNDEGPCLECYRSRRVVRDADLADDGPWPRFAAAARAQGFSSVDAIPLRARQMVLGALNLFGTEPLSDDALAVAMALADTATMTLLQADPLLDAATVTRRLQQAVQSRNTVEQAVGVLAERFSCDFDEAFRRLRRAGRDSGESLVGVARAVVDRDDSSPGAAALRS